MANLTKEQRLAKEAEEKAKMQAEIEAKIRAEYEEKLKAAKEELKSNAIEIQNTAKIPLDTVVPVVCNVIGGAIYKSAKTIGYTIDWDAYGSVEYVELSELVSMRNTARRFFEDNWIVLEDTENFTAVQLYDFLRVTKYYENAIIGYSFSKSLSLPGERIGYLVIPNEVADFEDVLAAANVATRILGYVNAPSLMQKAVAKCLDAQADVPYYDRNRETLYSGLKEMGFECIKPEGAFYLFMKSPIADEKEFCQAAKKHNILIVPGSSFACPGYVRIAYCVSYETIVNSMPGFKALAEEFLG